jgi:hypothetical protein
MVHLYLKDLKYLKYPGCLGLLEDRLLLKYLKYHLYLKDLKYQMNPSYLKNH